MKLALAKAYVVVRTGGQARRLPLGGAPFRIGRGNQNTLELPSDLVSRYHAMIELGEESGFYLYDLGSRNGTLLNGQRISAPARLQHGDVIQVGDYEIVFQWKESSTQARELSNPAETRIFHQMCLITVLVVDIRGFTPLAQRLGEARVAAVISAFNRDSGAVLQQLGSWGEKYIGDAVMAIWEHQDLESVQIMLAVLEGLSRVAAIAASLRGRFGLDSPVRVGAGINSGIASLGNLGGGGTADYTALGDVVNKTFRLESCTKDLGCDIAFGEESGTILAGSLDLDLDKMIGKHSVLLKGYTEPAQVYSMDMNALSEVIKSLRARGVRLGLLDRARTET